MHENQTERGFVVWHSSEEDGGPDVGISIGLGDGQLWLGELSKDRWEKSGGDDMDLGPDGGWWIVLYPAGNGEPVVLGRCPAEMDHSAACDLFASILRAPA